MTAIAVLIAAVGCDINCIAELYSPEGDGSPDAGGPSGRGPDGGSPDGGSTSNPNHVSAWLGTNVDSDLPTVDIVHQLNQFDTPDNQKDSNGYPVAGASGRSETDVGFALPTGAYKISFRGNGRLDVGGIGQLAGPWQSVNDEHRSVVNITATPGSFGGVLDLTITNSPGQVVQDIHLLLPSYDYDSAQIFTAELLRVLAPFRSLRFTGWMLTGIGGSSLSDWSDRPRASAFGASPYGVPYEHLVALVNQTGKDAWVSIPVAATDDFVQQFADYLRSNLNFDRINQLRAEQGISGPFKLFIEYSNEVWTPECMAWNRLLAMANADPQRFSGSYSGPFGPQWMAGWPNLIKVGQAQADRLVQIANIFRREFGAIGRSEVVAPILGGWALGAAFSDVGLRFIAEHYGPPSQYISYVAFAPYFDIDDGQTASLDSLFAGLNTSIQGFESIFRDFRNLADQYGIRISAYEGGQTLTGAINQQIKHLAQFDQRMYSAYLNFFALWKQSFGEAMFNHFTLAGTPGKPEWVYQYGYWGSLDSLRENIDSCGTNLPQLSGAEDPRSFINRFCPKYEALRQQIPH